jgi:hypothetical protein
MSFFGDDVVTRGSVYINADLEEMKKSYQGVFWTQVPTYFRYCEYVIMVFIYMHAKKNLPKIDYSTSIGQMFLFCMAFGIFGNIFEPVPHLGLRTQHEVSSLLIIPIFYYLRKYWNGNDININVIKAILIFAGALKILIGIRIVADITPISLVFCPLPFVGISQTSMSVLLGLN